MPGLLSTASFSERVRNMSPDEIRIPPEPPGRCSNHLQVGIESGKLENVSAGRGGMFGNSAQSFSTSQKSSIIAEFLTH